MSGTADHDTIRVLHADDDEMICDLVQDFLEQLDNQISVVTVTSPDAGLERYEDESIDCVVSDYEMPGTNGLEFLKAIREEYPNLPFILFTGKGSEEIASEALNAGADSYLQKDGTESYELLANRIRTVVGRRRSERKAKIAQDRLLALYEQTDGFYIVDNDWTVTYWNEVMEQRSGVPADEIIGEVVWDVFPEAVGTELYTAYQDAMETHEQAQFERYYEPADCWIEVHVHPVDEGLFIQSRDITDEKEQEQELQYRNEVLESFANTVSHDLRNPLNVAEGQLQLAQETGDFEHLEEVTQAHNRMRDLIDELLHFARGDDFELVEVSLEEIAQKAWATVTSEDVDLIVEDDLAFEVYGNTADRVFENLFWNAIDHGDAETIRVGALENGFYVEDDGSGIPESHRERVFESGFSTDEESPGYGLSIVQKIADLHNWNIRVTKGDSGGAQFEITNLEIEEG
ncbi:response regulator [Halopenitus persicus]|uniref:PAS domain S-box-containing protein n=1 Tax=Halopenitus persicus TaxID=1048396 RepID=A0A1H3JK56_9EURY|nr:response regulator [Halopenitus persicus]SDY39969.1 PAS domain S-box-containing protein [Halopenitus persicus]